MGKKIGIITFHSAHNFGAFLQCFALQKSLEKLGYNAYVINYRNKKIDKNYKIFNVRNNNLKSLIMSSLKNVIMLKKNIIRWYKFEKNINNLNLSYRFNNIEELKQNFPQYDCYIAGSDQIWNYDLLNDLEDAYTLNFGNKNIKRIAYAASVGDPLIISKHSDIFKSKLNIFDKLSVREEKISYELKKIIKKKIYVTLDPTLLLTSKEWECCIKDIKSKKIEEKYILVYQIGKVKEFIDIVDNLSDKIGYKVIHFERRGLYKNQLCGVYASDPFEFINYIKNAEYIITTSFHATVFSILFNKKVWCVPIGGAGVRITDLLFKLHMENRIIYNVNDVSKINYAEMIDYDKVHKLLDEKRQKSINWLISAIEK